MVLNYAALTYPVCCTSHQALNSDVKGLTQFTILPIQHMLLIKYKLAFLGISMQSLHTEYLILLNTTFLLLLCHY